MALAMVSVAAKDEHGTSVIDAVHLQRMTLGDRKLEREVLELFVRQNTIILARIIGAAPSVAVAAAHTLKGSARGIGAWRVARAAESLEQAAGVNDRERDLEEAIAELEAASLEACAAIGTLLTGLVVEPTQSR